MKKIVLYSSNSKLRSSGSNCTVFPKWADQWDAAAKKHPDAEITLVVQLNGRYFLDIHDGKPYKLPENIHVVQMDMQDKTDEFVETIADLAPDVAIAMPGPVGGFDWNGIRDAVIAKCLEKKGIKTICYSIETALNTFDKWRMHQVFQQYGFHCPEGIFVHNEMFFAGGDDPFSTGNVYQEMILKQVELSEMPLIIKSTTGSSSTGIFIAHTYEEAKDYLLSEKNDGDVIIEQFIKGEEFGTEVHGCKGNYHVMPPYKVFSTAHNEVNDPLGMTTLKYGPILDEKYDIPSLQKELKRLAETMGFAGIMQIDLMYADGAWYIIEINSRWSGMTTLITASQGRLPYEAYIEQETGSDTDYSDPGNLTFSCQFKMADASDQLLEQIAEEDRISSVISYEVVRPNIPTFRFNDCVISGFGGLREMADYLCSLQKKYPEQISAEVPEALLKAVSQMDTIRLARSEKNAVVISFYGRISADNAQEVEEELIRIRHEHTQPQLVLNFENLVYISSMGLRALLKMAKNEKQKIKIFNVSPEVYEILDDTGFVDLFETYKTLKKYSMDGFTLIGAGANGEVYRVDRENIIKVFQKSAPLETISRERNLARQALIAGIPTAISYTVVQADDRYGIMFELIDAESLSTVLKSNPSEYDHYTELYVSLYQKIHETKGDLTAFGSIKDIYREAISECKGYYTEEEGRKLTELLDSIPETGTLIHGDYHPNNIMVQDGELILIDMGDMSVGHPIFDFLATAATQVNLVELSPEYAEGHTKMPAELIRKTWRKLIDSYFADYDKEKRDRIEEQICLFSKLKVALAPYFGRGAGKEILDASIADAKANFLPKIDELIGTLDW